MIPPVVFRTVPATTTDEVERFWADTVAMHRRWVAITYRDPIDPAKFPITSPHWPACGRGAQRAGLIRLEGLFRHGGIYLDSDVECWRPLNSLLHCSAFAGYEDPGVIPDAVLGAEPEHPAIAACITLALDRIHSKDQSPWWSGPGVTTTVLKDRDDVLLLPPGSFYPVHYSAKVGADWAKARLENPWAFGAHRWHASWL